MRRPEFKVTITGVAGFVGSNLARALLASEYDVRVIGADLAPSPRIDDLVEHDAFEFVVYDAHHEVPRELLEVDTLYHFAGIADPERYLREPIAVMDLNIGGMRNILEGLESHPEPWPRIVYSSTSELYGKNAAVPFREDETDLIYGPTQRRRWCYAVSKAVSEHYLQAFGCRHTIFRFFNFVGPDIDAPGVGRVITRMVEAALDGTIRVTAPGTQTRCFTYVDDFVVPLVRATTYDRLKPGFRDESHVMNLGSTEEVSILDLAERIGRLVGDATKSAPDIELFQAEQIYGEGGYEDIERRVPDTARAGEVLDWEATTPLDTFLPRIVDSALARSLAGRSA